MKDHASSILRITFRAFAFIAALALIAWAILPEIRTQAAGFLLGLVFSWINTWYLVLKAKQIAEIAAGGGGRKTGLGFFMRVALSILAVWIAVEREQFDLLFTLIGLFSVNLIAVVAGAIILSRNNPRDDAKGVKNKDA